MAYGNSTNYRLAVNKETVWGTPLTTSAKYLRVVDASMKPDVSFIESNEINAAHRETADTVMTMAKGSGSINGEVSYLTFEPLLEGIFAAAMTGTTTRTLKIGQTRQSLTFQEQYADLTTIFKVYRGAIMQSLTLNVQVGQIITMGYTFVSKVPTVEAATMVGTVAAANTNAVMNPLADVRILQEGASLVALPGVQSLSITMQNDVTEIMGLGSADPLDLAPARIKVSGTIAVFKQDAALFSKLIGQTVSKLNLKIGGNVNKHYTWLLSNVKFTSYDGGASASNAILERFNYSALYDVTNSSVSLVAVD